MSTHGSAHWHRTFFVAAMVYMHFVPFGRADEVLRIGNTVAIPLVRIEPGEFEMGRSSRGSFTASLLSLGEQGDWVAEGPVWQVTINSGFLRPRSDGSARCRFARQ